LIPLFRRDDAMDRIATCAFAREVPVREERRGWLAFVVDCGSKLADAATATGP
jgi:hypothetical protein